MVLTAIDEMILQMIYRQIDLPEAVSIYHGKPLVRARLLWDRRKCKGLSLVAPGMMPELNRHPGV